ncbi:right-handed parallel beta-helix repeat-containing protein [Flagellimonas sp. 389]|uniref:glycoside hydrolase family 28 protein n=1 Tax=Flagellimonas sp. 389 TaxID=2835862 RepID=UPI001BD3303F|nr:glycosyl hydrolase family 28 protein [Flagellimonas sp. 389]MBS9462625.1 right-handed parallel beta-helix repeat-containing protein [Flagellimonas sp. 389]
MKSLSLFFSLPLLILMTCQKSTDNEFNILDYGAVADGKTLSTNAIQKAINKAVKTKGKVIVPQGTFYTGSLILGPDMTFHLEEGAVLLASNTMKDYTSEEFIKASFADNLSITGTGTINGNGLSFFDEDWNYTERPEPWIVIEDSKNVSVSGVTLKNSPSHTLNFDYCNGVSVSNIFIENDPKSPNTDGIDIRNSKNVTISNCDIRTGDDAICIKNTKKEEKLTDAKGNSRLKTTENITVKDCYIESDDSALKLGTGSGYLTKDITFENITIRKTRYAMALFMMDSGRYEDVLFKNIDSETGSRHDQEYGIFMDIHQRQADSAPGEITNIHFENCNISTKGIFYLSGHPEQYIQNISITGMEITIKDTLDNSEWNKPKGNKSIQHWPSTSNFVNEKANFIIANAENVRMKNVKVERSSQVSFPFLWTYNASVDTIAVQINTLTAP